MNKPNELFSTTKANQQIFEVLEASKTLTDSVFDELPIVLALMDERRRVLKLNLAGQQLFQRTEKSALGEPIDALLSRHTFEQLLPYFQSEYDQGERLSFEDIVHRDAQPRYYHWEIGSAFGAKTGRRTIHILIGSDMTEARVALEKLIVVKRDLEVASTVQSLLVPNVDVIQRPFCKMIGHYEPAQQVGGDLWWHQDLPGVGMMTLVGDVTGHGVGSAMVGATLIGGLSAMAAQKPPRSGDDLPRFLGDIGAMIERHFQGNYIVCYAAVMIVAAQHQAIVTGAGFPSLLLLRPDAPPKSLYLRGDPFGLAPMNKLVVETLAFRPGDRIVCFSDGCYETSVGSTALQRRDFKASLTASQDDDLVTARGKIAAELKKNRSTPELEDDVTVVLIDRV